MTTSVAIGAMFTLIGCGGGSDSDTNTGGTNPTPAATGTAYYIDSAVSGVNYTCGAQEGITGADGSFTFETGASCTFYLGDMELRGVDAGLLVDGVSVYETDMEIARILQSLDSDGDPENGITIDAEIVAALAAHDIGALPTSEAEMDEMLAVIAANGGTEVGETAAQEHVLNTLVVGKTVYQKCGETVDSMVFQTNGELVSVENGEEVTVGYRIEGNIVYTIEEDGEDAHIFVDATADFIKFQETEGDITTFYFTAEAAQAGAASDCGGEDDGEPIDGPIEITEAMLNEKVFYFHVTDDDGESAYIKYSFYPSSSVIYTELVASDGSSDAFDLSYSIGDGKIVIQDGDETKIIVAFEMNNDRWMVQKEGDDNMPLMWYLSKPGHFPESL